MENSSEILAAIKAMQAHLEGQILATNQTFQELRQSVDSRFAELQIEPHQFGSGGRGSGGFGRGAQGGFGRGAQWGQNNDISPVLRSMKMEVPKFDGTDPQGWLFRVEEFFDFRRTPDHMRLRIVSFHMEGRAVSWFQWMKANNLLTTWMEFISSLKSRFGSSPFNDPQGLLSKLTQTSSVADFQSEFEDLMNHVSGISEPLLISFFITGLRADIRRELSFARPPTLMEAFSLARAFEVRLDEAKDDFKSGNR